MAGKPWEKTMLVFNLKDLFPEYREAYWNFCARNEIPAIVQCHCGSKIRTKISKARCYTAQVTMEHKILSHGDAEVSMGLGQCEYCGSVYWTCLHLETLKEVTHYLVQESNEARDTMKAMVKLVKD